ncbi:MAG: ABC transporter ATP-binding protein [Pseudomonadota bacterium]
MLTGDRSGRRQAAALLQVVRLRTPLIGPVDLEVAVGECVAILGASGAGKSLLLRAIADLDPSEGSVRLDGRDRDAVPATEWRRSVGLVPAESGWWADRVDEHFPTDVDVGALLEAVCLSDAWGWDVQRLSTGERQRLALVRALANRPRALLLDEPTAALDAAATTRIEALIRGHCAAGVAVLLVTHDVELAARLADRRLVMERGGLHGDDG